MKRTAFALLAVIALLITAQSPASAYVDAGAGSTECWMTVTLNNGDNGGYNGCSNIYMFPDGSTSETKAAWPSVGINRWETYGNIWNNFWQTMTCPGCTPRYPNGGVRS